MSCSLLPPSPSFRLSPLPCLCAFARLLLICSYHLTTRPNPSCNTHPLTRTSLVQQAHSGHTSTGNCACFAGAAAGGLPTEPQQPLQSASLLAPLRWGKPAVGTSVGLSSGVLGLALGPTCSRRGGREGPAVVRSAAGSQPGFWLARAVSNMLPPPVPPRSLACTLRMPPPLWSGMSPVSPAASGGVSAPRSLV